MDAYEAWRRRIAPKVAAFRRGESPLFTNEDLPPDEIVVQPTPSELWEAQIYRLPSEWRDVLSAARMLRRPQGTTKAWLDAMRLIAEVQRGRRDIDVRQRALRLEEQKQQLSHQTALLDLMGRLLPVLLKAEDDDTRDQALAAITRLVNYMGGVVGIPATEERRPEPRTGRDVMNA